MAKKWKTQAAQAVKKFKAAAILQIVQEYENGRNSGAATGKIILGQSIIQKGTTYNGTVEAYSPPAPGASPEKTMWAVFKAVMSYYPDLVAAIDTYIYNRQEDVTTDGTVLKAWPMYSNILTGTAGSLTVTTQLRVYKATPDDTIEDDLMDLIHLFRLAVQAVPDLDDYNAEITKENIECVEQGATCAEAWIEVKITPK